MRTLQDYRDIFREISNNLGFQGDSVELLVQLLANASYVGEVENISYEGEASLDRAVLNNSKIQHCIDMMYSVYRGSCPRIILNIKPSKYFNFNLFDEIIVSNNFKVYYIGYWGGATEGSTLLDNFVYAPKTVAPSSNPLPIIGILAKETVSKNWVLKSTNTYFVDAIEDDLSNDLWVKVDGAYVSNTRQFSDHILNDSVFDLTLPSFGSRLYVPSSKQAADVSIEALYYKYSTLDSYLTSEIKKLQIRGGEIVSFDELNSSTAQFEDDSNLAPGMMTIKEGTRDSLVSIHYKANRDRYVNSILRSNSDLGTLLEEDYSEKIYSGGTSYIFESSSETGKSLCTIYYIPKDLSNLLTDEEKNRFRSTRRSYYVGTESNNPVIVEGTRYLVNIVFDVVLYKSNSNDDINKVIEKDILPLYSFRFGINLEESRSSIESLLSKVSNVEQVTSITITYFDESGNMIDPDEDVILYNTSYFDISYNLNTVIQSTRI